MGVEDFIAENAVNAVGFIGTFLMGFFIAKWQVDKDYEYKRSEYITQKRFDLEMEAIQGLSKNLHLLCTMDGWDDDLERETREQLGTYAPIIDYRDTDGKRTCGVGSHREDIRFPLRRPKHPKYISKRYADRHVCKACSGALPGGDCCWQQENLYTRAERLLVLAVEAKKGQGDRSSKSASKGEHLRHSNLEESYDWFSSYAWARLQSIEMGRRDKRRQTAKDILLPWHTGTMARFDDGCGLG